MKSMSVVLGTAVVLLALGIPGINVYHHVELPTINKYRIESNYQIVPLLSKHYDIVLEDVVRGNIWYEDVGKVLRDANYGDTITFHLAGFGGQEDSMYLLINQIHGTKAEVTMSVEAPVYSAYAYLATSGDKLVMYPYTWLMFHFSSVLNTDCTTATGTDRGVSNVEHCNAFKNTVVAMGNVLVNSNKVLTAQEKERIKTGHDVYLPSNEVMLRLDNRAIHNR